MNTRQFALLEHTTNHDVHWDLLIEVPDEDPLATWRVLLDPLTHDTCPVIPLPPHRRIYLEYEGPISGDRGHVRRIDRGTVRVGEGFSYEHGGPLQIEGATWRGSYRIEQEHLTRLGPLKYDDRPV